MTQDAIIKEVLDAQYDLQVALGIHRLDLRDDIPGTKHPEMVEERMAKSLARLHKLLDTLGKPMYNPASHPEV